MKIMPLCFGIIFVTAVINGYAKPGASSTSVSPPTLQQEISDHQRDFWDQSGEDALCANHYTEAEKDFRTAAAIDALDCQAHRGIAEALRGGGKFAQSVQVYRTLTTEDPLKGSTYATEMRTQMGYAIALNQAGQWQEAVAVYEKALPDTTRWGDAPKIDVHFDPQVPLPNQLQALAHVAIGAEYFGQGINDKAFYEYEKAIQSDPNSGFANYYYGYGWNHLDPNDKARVINTSQAKAALQKAVKIGNADVKKAAAKALAAMEDAPKAPKKPA